MKLSKFIRELPKAELHLHIEGTLEPELLFSLAKRNKIKLKYRNIQELRKAYKFENLQDFLNIYYEGCGVLQTKKDFYDLTLAYFSKVSKQGVKHVELFFDPQSHTSRAIPFHIVIEGIHAGCMEAKKRLRISSKIILCFLRHLSEEDARLTLEEAIPFRKWIYGVGLDSSEKGNPPAKFKRVFFEARKAGFRTVAHAGEEGPANYVSEAVSLLKVSRIDHGNHALDDKGLVKKLAKGMIPLTVCPLSNIKLRVVKDMHVHPLKIMMKSGLLVNINSDDPAYFGGYIGENYQLVGEALNLSREELAQLAENSFEASFLPSSRKKYYISLIKRYARMGKNSNI